jgi:autotransporter-associated beta strand protein
MKPLSPHDPLDELIAAALHGELTPEERAPFEARLAHDPAAQAAYQEAQAMHDLLEKTHQSAQPDSAFEQRMVSGVRRKLQHDQHRETGLESLLLLWAWLKRIPKRFRLRPVEWAVVLGLIAIIWGASLGPITRGIKQAQEPALMQQAARLKAVADPSAVIGFDVADARLAKASAGQNEEDFSRRNTGTHIAQTGAGTMILTGANTYSGGTTVSAGTLRISNGFASGSGSGGDSLDISSTTTPTVMPQTKSLDQAQSRQVQTGLQMDNGTPAAPVAAPSFFASAAKTTQKWSEIKDKVELAQAAAPAAASADADGLPSPASAAAEAAAPDTRKLIRNAQLDLEVKSFQAAMDQITALTQAAGGYVDTSNSQRGGNGKLQGMVVVKVLPQNLDAFLLKLRGLGDVQNQSVSTDDVTKDYFDTQARLDNSRRMETQLQDLLKHANSKVSDLLQVERELGRVRGDIEQMQGQLKLYDFQVQYATVTMAVREKDLNQTAAYLLKEQDDFSLFATDVEATFQKARQTAEDFKAQVLAANLNHNSGSDISAELTVMVAPDQIEPFLAQVRSLGRVDNFTRQTQRVAKDGGNSENPADQTLTEKDKVQVHLAIRSDDETRKQVALTVVAKAVDDALDQAKTTALAHAGVEILSSSLNKTAQGQSTAQLSVRVPGQDYAALIAAFEALGRTDSLSVQRNDNAGPGVNGDDAPVIVSLALTDDDAPLQETEMSVLGGDVDGEAQQIKKEAAAAGVEVKASSFERQPDGTELAQMTFRLPMAKYPAFLESMKTLGKVESLSVRRDDRPDQTRTDETAPAEITLRVHNQADIVAEDHGLWATLRQTFGEGAGALFTSVRTIGVIVAFLAPWVVLLVLCAWVGRRIYIARKK